MKNLQLLLCSTLFFTSSISICSQETQSTETDSMFSLNSQDSQFSIQSYHASEQGTQIHDGYDDISSQLHQPTPPENSMLATTIHQGHQLHRTTHVHQPRRTVAIVTQDSQASYTSLSQQTEYDSQNE